MKPAMTPERFAELRSYSKLPLGSRDSGALQASGKLAKLVFAIPEMLDEIERLEHRVRNLEQVALSSQQIVETGKARLAYAVDALREVWRAGEKRGDSWIIELSENALRLLGAWEGA